jgi:hypothetical protein
MALNGSRFMFGKGSWKQKGARAKEKRSNYRALQGLEETEL